MAADGEPSGPSIGWPVDWLASVGAATIDLIARHALPSGARLKCRRNQVLDQDVRPRVRAGAAIFLKDDLAALAA